MGRECSTAEQAATDVVARAHASDGSCVTYSQAVACSCATVPLPPPTVALVMAYPGGGPCLIDRALVMTLGMSIYMLWRLLGYASLVGLAVMISFAPVMGWFSKASMVRGCSAACLAAHGLCLL